MVALVFDNGPHDEECGDESDVSGSDADAGDDAALAFVADVDDEGVVEDESGLVEEVCGDEEEESSGESSDGADECGEDGAGDDAHGEEGYASV